MVQNNTPCCRFYTVPHCLYYLSTDLHFNYTPLFALYCTVYTICTVMHFKQFTVLFTLYCTVYIVLHCIHCTALFTLYCTVCTICTVLHFTLYGAIFCNALNTVQCILHGTEHIEGTLDTVLYLQSYIVQH